MMTVCYSIVLKFLKYFLLCDSTLYIGGISLNRFKYQKKVSGVSWVVLVVVVEVCGWVDFFCVFIFVLSYASSVVALLKPKIFLQMSRLPD